MDLAHRGVPLRKHCLPVHFLTVGDVRFAKLDADRARAMELPPGAMRRPPRRNLSQTVPMDSRRSALVTQTDRTCPGRLAGGPCGRAASLAEAEAHLDMIGVVAAWEAVDDRPIGHGEPDHVATWFHLNRSPGIERPRMPTWG